MHGLQLSAVKLKQWRLIFNDNAVKMMMWLDVRSDTGVISEHITETALSDKQQL